MLKKIVVMVAGVIVCGAGVANAQPEGWPPGGPGYLYVTPTKKPPHHGVYDETMKCLDCHKWDGVDAYTSATMTLKKSKTGQASLAAVENAIRDALKGKGDYREIYVLSTAFDNKPLATVIEFVLDPETFALYAVSEKQTEKLFHIAANKNVSLAYVKQRDDYEYFEGALGVQIVGQARQLRGTDPEFEEAARIYIKTLPMPKPQSTIPQPPSLDMLVEMIKPTKIITKVVPERIVILNRTFKDDGFHAVQIWEPEK